MERFAVACMWMITLALASSACSNHGTWRKIPGALNGAITGRNAPAPTPSSSPTPQKTGTSGTWTCTDSPCAPQTIKTISPKLDSIETTYLEYLPAISPQSICHVREVEHLTILVHTSEDSLTAEITPQPKQLVESPENTHDCADVIAKLNEFPNPPSTATLVLSGGQLTINDVHYRALTETVSADPRIAGEWDCMDSGFESLKQTISPDLRTLTSESVFEFSNQEKCRIRETSNLQITDDTDPQKIYASRARVSLMLVDSPENTAKCGEIVQDINQQRTQEGVTAEQVLLERDGTLELLFEGHRFVRKPRLSSESKS